jgi:hypothetical protein
MKPKASSSGRDVGVGVGRDKSAREERSEARLARMSYVVLVVSVGFLGGLVFTGRLKGEDAAGMLVAGALVGVLNTVVGYWFGSSIGSKRAAERGEAAQAQARARRRTDKGRWTDRERGEVGGGEGLGSRRGVNMATGGGTDKDGDIDTGRDMGDRDREEFMTLEDIRREFGGRDRGRGRGRDKGTYTVPELRRSDVG